MIHTPPGAWPTPGPEYLSSARFIDSGTESVRRFAQDTVAGATSDIDLVHAISRAFVESAQVDHSALRVAVENGRAKLRACAGDIPIFISAIMVASAR